MLNPNIINWIKMQLQNRQMPPGITGGQMKEIVRDQTVVEQALDEEFKLSQEAMAEAAKAKAEANKPEKKAEVADING